MPSSTPLTMPDERTRALLQKGAFLKEVAQEVRLPEEVRREAYRLLRHCPTASQVRTMALIYQHAALERYLSPDFDPRWLDGYRHGAPPSPVSVLRAPCRMHRPL